jgi:hypothetical protein
VVAAQTITILAEDPPLDVPCAQMITPWSMTVDLGQLPAGSYQLQVVVPSAIDLSTALTVFGNFIYLPTVNGSPAEGEGS